MENEMAILCIDDEKIVLDSLKLQLRELMNSEIFIETAESAAEGLEIIDELVESNIKVLLIVSDWLMPHIRGDEFLIRVHNRFPQIVKVLLTGQADESAIKRAFEEANLYKVIRKPWSESELLEVVQHGLSKTYN